MLYRQRTNKTRLILIPAFFLVAFLFVFSHYVSAESMLEIGSDINTKMKALAGETFPVQVGEKHEIKAIRMADSLPDDFIPSETNTVSTSHSAYPVYIFFDNEDDAGIIYFFTEGETVVMNPDSGYMFAGNPALTDISGLSRWDSSQVINMNALFSGAKSLTDILALQNWDTSHVMNMYALFYNASSLQDALALRNWNFSNVTNMSYMFSNASSLRFVDVSNWDTSKVTSMVCTFQVGDSHKGNGQLIEINGLDNLDVSNVTDMTCLFYGAGQMTYYDVSNWNVSKVESMNHMFCDNYGLVSLDLSGWDVSNVKTIYCMFDDCQKLKTIGDVSRWNTINLIDAGGWLNDARSFVGDNEGTLDLSGWDTNNLKAAGEMFLNTKLHTIDLSGWTFDSITNEKWEGTGHGIYYESGNSSETLRGFGQMFKGTKNLTTVFVSQSGLDSFNSAVEREVNTLDMWTDSKTDSFIVK